MNSAPASATDPASGTAPDGAVARVYIGTDPTQEIASLLLQDSMRRHSSMPVVFDEMQALQLPFPREAKNQPRTNFSFNRFAIPGLAGHHGRALYVDSDMLVFKDVREVFEIPFDGATVLHAPSSTPSRQRQFSVMMLDCGRLGWNATDIVNGLDEGRYDYQQLFWDFCIEPQDAVQPRLPVEWNSLDAYVPGRTALVHYTHMDTQPWVHARHPHGDVWVQALADGLEAGVVPAALLDDHVRRGWARPSLARQVRLPARQWPAFKRFVAPVLDLGFKPHRALRERERANRKRDARAAA